MIRRTALLVAVVAALAAAPAHAALYEENFDGGTANQTLNSFGYLGFTDASTSTIRISENTSFSGLAIDGSTANLGWSRNYRPFDGGPITSGMVVLSVDMDPGSDGDAELGYFGASNSNGTSDRLVSMRYLSDGSGGFSPGGMCISRAAEGNVCSTVEGRVHVDFSINLDTDEMSADITGLDGQGSEQISATLDNKGNGLTALFVTAATGDGFAVDNILVAVPEPATVGLLSLGALLMATRRRRA